MQEDHNGEVIGEMEMIEKAVLLVTALCVPACSNPGAEVGRSSQDASPPTPPQLAPELLSAASRPANSAPGFLVDSYGLESGEIGVKECDTLVALMMECDGVAAEAKQQRLGWKLAVRQAAGDPARLRVVANECRSAEAAMQARMKDQGCGPAARDR